MKILVSSTSFRKPQNSRASELLEDFADEIVYNEYNRPLEASEVARLAQGCDGYIAGLDYIDSIALAALPNLKVISRYGSGIDRVDLDMAASKGIIVTNTPGTNSTAVCELTIGLMISLVRRIPQLNSAVNNGEWPISDGMELKGKTLAILGLGAIGKKLAKIAVAFEMNVVAYDPYMNTKYANANDIKSLSFDDAVKSADIISLHMPLMASTRHLINESVISMMKDGAYIINTARGGLIDEKAAYNALKSKKLAGMALDAYEIEPVVDSPLVGLPSVISTPHTGAHTSEAISAMGMMSVENLIAVLSGKECDNIVV